jgi:hypothetical protein
VVVDSGPDADPYTDDGPSYEEFAKLDPAVKARMFAWDARMDGDIAEQAPWTCDHTRATERPGR